MKAVIMCGGIGSRMKPLTENLPKPLLRVLNVPILEQIINRLILSGVGDIYLSLGYRAQDIISFCERKRFNAEIHYCEEEKPLGTAGGVKNCLCSCDEEVVVLSGDNLFDIDLGKVVQYHKAAQADITVVGKDVPDPREYGVIKKDKTGRIISFSEKPTWENAESTVINTGIYVLSGDMLACIPEKQYCDFALDVFPSAINKNKKIMCYQTEDFWGDIGEFGVYRDLSFDMLKYFTDVFLYSGTLYSDDVIDANGNKIIAPCLIGKNCTFGEGNTIGPYAVFADGIKIENNCSIRNCVIGERVEIRNRCDMENAIVDDDCIIADNCAIEEDSVLGYGVKIGKFSRILQGCKIWPGRTVAAESLVSEDLFYETPERFEADIFGVSGKLFSQLSLSDCLKLGQAAASVKGINRIGVGCDARQASVMYKTVIANGICSCGVICYDFDRMFKAQSYFFSAYGGLDLFIYVAYANGTVNLSFTGEKGFPVTSKTARAINNNYRFSVYRYAAECEIKEIYNMNLLSFAYNAALNKTISLPADKTVVQFECENELIKQVFNNTVKRLNLKTGSDGIQFIINNNGTDMYAIENGLVYTSDQIKTLICEMEFAEGRSTVIREDMPEMVNEKAESYACKCIRLFENEEPSKAAPETLLENIWNFDALFLSYRLLNVILQTKMSLHDLLSIQRCPIVKNKVVDLNCDPSEIRRKIGSIGAKKREAGNPYYYCRKNEGLVKIRQMGNASRVRILVEAESAEAAKELSGDICAKLTGKNIEY